MVIAIDIDNCCEWSETCTYWFLVGLWVKRSWVPINTCRVESLFSKTDRWDWRPVLALFSSNYNQDRLDSPISNKWLLAGSGSVGDRAKSSPGPEMTFNSSTIVLICCWWWRSRWEGLSCWWWTVFFGGDPIHETMLWMILDCFLLLSAS